MDGSLDLTGRAVATLGRPETSTPPTSRESWEPPRLNDATRHLCAGVYVDPGFRDHLLRDVYNDTKRRFAPCYGFDPIPVLRHAWRSWRLDTAQHLIVTILLGAMLVWRPLVGFLVASVALVWWAGGQLTGLVAARWRHLVDRQARIYASNLDKQTRIFAGLLTAGLASIGATIAILAVDGPADSFTRGTLIDALALVLAPIAVAAMFAGLRQYALDRVFDEPARPPGQRLSGRLAILDAYLTHGFTIYGGHRPFIGSGTRVRGWSFVQRLVPPKSVLAQLDPGADSEGPIPEYRTPPFRTGQLVTHLYDQIRSLRDEPDPELSLPGLRVADHVFIEGTHAPRFLDEFRADEAGATERVMATPTDAARHYLACHIESWGGEVLTSVFVHVSLQGRTLYLEFSTYALPPTCREFQRIDSIGETGVGARWRAARSSVRRTPQLLRSPLQLITATRLLFGARRAGRDRTLQARRGVNTGARFSLREEAVWRPDQRDADPEDRTQRLPDIDYFQLGDINKHSQIIERRLLTATADFLKLKKVDTSEFMRRADTILNNGIISTGANATNVQDSTIGDHANFTNTGTPSQ
jgi:hypothetical protein